MIEKYAVEQCNFDDDDELLKKAEENHINIKVLKNSPNFIKKSHNIHRSKEKNDREESQRFIST